MAFSVEPSTRASGCFARDANAQRHHAQAPGDANAVEHDRDQPQTGQIGSHQLGQSPLGGSTNRRQTADRLVDAALAATCSPTGFKPTPWRRVDSPASIRSNAVRPNT
jgi:hypothetical protein